MRGFSSRSGGFEGEAAPAGSTYAGRPAEAVSLDAAPNADADAAAPLLV